VVACTPHPGYGTVAVRSGALVRHVDLATCRTWTTKAPKQRVVVPTLSVAASRLGSRGKQTIVDNGRAVYTVRERYDRIPGGSPGPLELFGTSPDGKWVLFAIDPQNSASLAADGLTLQAVPVAGGKPRVVATGLVADDYRTWCGGRLVMTAGGDRVAANHKWLIVTGPPLWHARILVRNPKLAFGSLACAGTSIVVQATHGVGLNEAHVGFPRWSLWRVAFDGTHTVLDTPRPGFSDDSPRVGRGGTVVFVRSHQGLGELWALGVGPLANVGRDDGYYGHRPWDGLTWSLQR
jgi:hypothetical protein